MEVNGSMASLSAFGGFRCFIQTKATELRLTGTVQRYDKSDVKVVLEGTKQQLCIFLNCIDSLINDTDMITRRMFLGQAQVVLFRECNSFSIVMDERKRKENKGTIVKGQYSPDKYDLVSNSSANSPVVLQGSQPSRPASRASNK